MKMCRICEVLKSIEDFYSDETWCKKCRLARNNETRRERVAGRLPKHQHRKTDQDHGLFECTGCHQMLPRESFYADKRTKWGVRNRCIPCYDSQVSARTKKDRNLRSNYGMSIEQFESLLLAQGGRCAVCGTNQFGKRGPFVDHNHGCCPGRKTCGMCLRGIVCHHCNIAIGQIESGGWIIEIPQITRYLEVYSHVQNQKDWQRVLHCVGR